MMRMTRVRLVNWHYFADETIEIGRSTLLAGDNGSGKSTIIDAVQYALVAQIQRIRFNAAASDRRTARTLESYTRAKVGADALDYLREDCLSHVILEFRDDGRGFCAGILVESFREGDCREHAWIADDVRIEDIPVYREQLFAQPSSFRETVKSLGARVCATKGEYNNQLTHRLGVHRRGTNFNPYLEALVRSVSFTPFTSVHDFVCDYILDERTVDVGAMKENLLNYRAAEREAVAMEERIALLEEVAEKKDALVQIIISIERQEYLRLRLQAERERLALRNVESEVGRLEAELKELSRTIEMDREKRRRLEGQRDELRDSLARNEEHLAYQRLQRDRQDLAARRDQEQNRSERASQLREDFGRLLGRDPGDGREEAETVSRETAETGLAEARGELAVKESRESLHTAEVELSELERGLLRYPPAVEQLRKALSDAGIQGELLAELVEVVDERRQEAVESWLAADRFAVLVPPDAYSRALEIYNSMPADVAEVPLPNLADIRGEEVRAGTLAEVVEATGPAARRLVAHLLGDVLLTDLPQLIEEDRALTDSMLLYDRKIVRRRSPEIRRRWYLGRRAAERRRTQLQEEIAALKQQLQEREQELSGNRARLESLRRAERILIELEQVADAALRLEQIEAEFHEIEQRIAEIDTTGFDSIRIQLEALEGLLDGLSTDLEKKTEQLGGLKSTLESLRQKQGEHKRALSVHEEEVEAYLADRPERRQEFEAYYRDRTRDRKGPPDYDGMLGRYESAYRGLRTREERARHALIEAKQYYNHQYNALMEIDQDKSDAYLELLDRYRRTELPEYRERIQRARHEAERQFQEHFVARLNEYLIEAEESFKEINAILDRISFGKDSYRFTIHRRKDKRDLMHAIATAAEVRQVEGTLFAALKSDEERRTVQAVFDRILDHELDSPEVREICDYRQYFVYDIKIRDGERVDEKTGAPLESFLSKVLREKSGGETQTPYYVAIAASFHRFYRDNPAAIRLVLFDEAFNKMDDARIGRMLDFFRRLEMQVITAVPTEKIESVAPHMDVTNLVIRRNYQVFIRRYEQVEDEAS